MTITAHPGHHHITGTTAALAAAGALLAAGVGFGVAAFVLDEAPAIPSSVVSNDIGTTVGGSTGDVPKDPNGFAGTDRETRAFMHRN